MTREEILKEIATCEENVKNSNSAIEMYKKMLVKFSPIKEKDSVRVTRPVTKYFAGSDETGVCVHVEARKDHQEDTWGYNYIICLRKKDGKVSTSKRIHIYHDSVLEKL